MKPAAKWITTIATLLVLACVGAALGATWLTGTLPPPFADRPTEASTDPLPELYQAPAFSLTNQHGETVTDKDLAGRIWVGDFIFTRCPTVCPVLTSRMAKLQNWLDQQPGGGRVQLVSFSVDPAHDTPQVLREFAQKHEADFDRWHFLTATEREGASPQDRIWRLVEDGFKLPVGENERDAPMPIMHSSKMVLVDASGQIRGYYGGTSDRGQQELRRALSRLLRTE